MGVMTLRNRPFRLSPATALAAISIVVVATLSASTNPVNAASAAKSKIRGVDFRNFTWTIEGVELTTKDGIAEVGNSSDADYLYFKVLDVDHGDLDGDGIEEAVVTTVENTGGTGQFTDAVVFRYGNSGPVQVVSHGVGDRADGGIHDVVIVNGAAQIQRYTAGQGACCPTEISTYFVKLKGNKLVTVKPTTVRATINLGTLTDAATTRIEFLKGTSTANLQGSATERAGGYFEARQGQTVTLRVLKREADSLAGTARVLRDSTVLLEVKQGTSGSIKLPSTGRFRIELAQTSTNASAQSYSYVELEFSIR